MRAFQVGLASLVAGIGLTSPLPATADSPGLADQATPAVVARPPFLGETLRVDIRLRTAVRQLPVAVETRSGYDRDKFNLWVDADGDCRDTRAEVLAAESKVAVTGGCTVERGRWYSYYDARVWRRAPDVDIDHLVPLAEAWDSGAKKWNADTRERYANDLADRRSLVAVTDNVNQSKGDQDVGEWLPEQQVCRYVREWTAVKTRWSLAVERHERRALVRRASHCRNVVLHVKHAKIGSRQGGGGGGGGGGSIGRVRILTVVYDPPGNDTENAETLTLVNRGRRTNLKGLTLRDSDGARYALPSYRIGHDRRVVVHSGHGRNRRGHLYAAWGFTWNNDGDTARLLNAGGQVLDRCSWGDGAGTAHC